MSVNYDLYETPNPDKEGEDYMFVPAVAQIERKLKNEQ